MATQPPAVRQVRTLLLTERIYLTNF